MPWRTVYWGYSAVLPFTLSSFEALKLSSYEASRAPNVSLLVQMVLTFTFYGLWVFAPRLIWLTVTRDLSREASNWRDLLTRLGGLGLALSAVHLLFLALVLLTMHSAPGWGLPDVVRSFGEVWLGNAGIWLIAYVVAVALILYAFTAERAPEPLPTRYEVRQNGKTLSISFADIYWIKAAGNYAELHTIRGVLMVRKTLSQIAKEVASSDFLKSHRGALVNGRHVVSIRPHENGSGFVVQLSNDQEAPLSRRKLSEFRRLLKSIS